MEDFKFKYGTLSKGIIAAGNTAVLLIVSRSSSLLYLA